MTEGRRRHPQSGTYFGQDGLTEIQIACECASAFRIIPAEDSEIIIRGSVYEAAIRFTLADAGVKWLIFKTPELQQRIQPMFCGRQMQLVLM